MTAKPDLIQMIGSYGDACCQQGKSIASNGYSHSETHAASGVRIDKFNMIMVEIDRVLPNRLTRPVVTTLCGSSRFPDLHMQVMMALTLQGRVVIPMGCYGHADFPVGARFLTSDGDEKTPEKQQLDELHFRKIEMSDGIYVVNPGDYVGSSTMREVVHAHELGKTVEWMFPTKRNLVP